MCQSCRVNPAAINYIKDGRKHYRSKCGTCLKNKKSIRPNISAWQKSGYKKKIVCEMCGFKGMDLRQLTVFYLDGNMNNNSWTNLKTVCANCGIEISIKGFRSVENCTLPPDF